MATSTPTQFRFNHLPPELRLEILSHCPQNDLVCLSLASKSFRELCRPMIPEKPSLQSYDQNLPPDSLVCRCGNDKIDGVIWDPAFHRIGKHVYSGKFLTRRNYKERCKDGTECRNYPADHALCRQRWCTHCTCISCPLYVRLRRWMGDKLRYCSQCQKFTKRKWAKKYNGRCLHGRPKVRKVSNNRWTAKKGQSWGPRWWRLWGTQSIDYLDQFDYEPRAFAGRNQRVV